MKPILLLIACFLTFSTGLAQEATAEATPELESASDYVARAEASMGRMEFRFAVVDYDAALALDAVNIDALIGRARAGTEIANWEQVLADTNLVLAVQPENAAALSIRGYVTALTVTEADGLADLQAAKIADPDSTDPYNYLALYYLSQRKLDEALTELNASLELDPEQPLTLNSRSIAHYYQEDIAQSLEDLDAAIALNPQSAFLLTNRAALGRSNGTLQSSLADLNQAIATQPSFALAYLQRAFTYIELAKVDATQARPYYETAIADLDAYIRLENPDDAFSGIADYRADLVAILVALP